MEYLIIYLVLNTFVSLIVSSFFKDRKIGSGGVFWISLFLSPLIGILIGLSSERVVRKSTSPFGRFLERKQKILDQIETLKKEDELGLISEESRVKLEELKQEYMSMDEEKERDRLIKERDKKRLESKKRIRKQFLFLFIFTISIVLLFWISVQIKMGRDLSDIIQNLY